MQRRSALKSLATGLGTALVLPAWANSWNEKTILVENSVFSQTEEKTLAQVVSAIIPEGEVPGALSLGVHSYINRIVTDCYEPKIQDEFKKGLQTVEKMSKATYSKSFDKCSSNEQLNILKAIQVSSYEAKRAFVSLMKNLTIQGYTTREKIMVEHLHYVMAPGHYFGCVSV